MNEAASRSWRQRAGRRGSPENFRAIWTVLQGTFGRIPRFSGEPSVGRGASPEKREEKTPAIPAAWSRFSREPARFSREASPSNKNGTPKGAQSSPKSLKMRALRAHAPQASSMRGVWPRSPPRRVRQAIHDAREIGEIDAGEPGGGEPQRRLSGGGRRGGRCTRAKHGAGRAARSARGGMAARTQRHPQKRQRAALPEQRGPLGSLRAQAAMR